MDDIQDLKIREPNPDVNADVSAMVTLLAELTDLIGAENRYLQKGLPASMSDAVARKAVLAGELSQWVGAIQTQKITLSDASPALRAELASRGTGLEVVMHENATRLKAAIAATRQRINAVMYAIREQGEYAAGYGANGHTRAVTVPSGNASRVV